MAAFEAEKVWSRLAHENPIAAAAATDSKDWFSKYPQLIDKEIPRNNPQIVLDAGCGYGRVAIPLLTTRSQLRIIGVDASAEMLQTFSSLLEPEDNSHLRPRIILVHSGISTMPFNDDTFDCIYSCAVILHNPYNEVPHILREFFRVLKPRGKLILASSFPNIYNPEGMQNYLFIKMLVRPEANGPVRVYSRKRVRDLFSDWSEARIILNGAVFLPRKFAGYRMPFGSAIRRVNEWFQGQEFALVRNTSVFSKLFDVVAIK
jgi:ubiquinone/menaquinone biosynthesis C-methylase UbiE